METVSAISRTGIMASAPAARAVIIVVVARKTSNTTQEASARCAGVSALNSAGAKSTWSDFIGVACVAWRSAPDGLAYNERDTAGHSRCRDQNRFPKTLPACAKLFSGAGNRVHARRASLRRRWGRRSDTH